MNLITLTLDVHRVLDLHELPHAFGGALALAYAADPRGTADLDVNVFVDVDQSDRVVGALSEIGLVPEVPTGQWLPEAGVRFRSTAHPFPVDTFLSLDDAYVEMARRVTPQPFGPDAASIPVLSADDLVVFKLSFNRPKDWVDLTQIASRTPLDLDYIERTVIELRGPSMYPRVSRLRTLVPRSQP